MNWRNAIKLSPRKTASRFEDMGKGFKKVTIKYSDGSGYVLITRDNRVEFDNSREALPKELDGYNDWEPSI